MKHQYVRKRLSSRLTDRTRTPRSRDHAVGVLDGPWAAALRAEPTPPGQPNATERPGEIARLNKRLRDAHLDTVMALVASVEAKDPHTKRHSTHVSHYAGCLARELRMSGRQTEVARIAAVLHDLGKIAVPDSVLTKPGPLTADEYAVIKQHPATGAAILRFATCLRRELPLVLHHHEWYDGSGYPAGLKGDQIPFGARVLHVADSIDAMVLPRSYKKGYGLDKVVFEIKGGRGSQFDPVVADVALRWLSDNPDDLIPDVQSCGPKLHL